MGDQHDDPGRGAQTPEPVAESEARLRALADNLPHAMIYQISVSADGKDRRFTFVGKSCERLNGVRAEDVLADPLLLYRVIAPEDREAVALEEMRAQAAGRPFDMEVGFLLATGERRWSRLSSAPRTLPDGSTVWDGIQLDITESRLSQEALATEQNRLALAVEATGLGLWEYDLRNGALTWDARVKAIYGVEPDEAVTYALYISRLHPEDRDRAVQTYGEAIAQGAEGYSMEHRTLRPDGTVTWVLGSARILRDRRGAPYRVIGSVLDITERKLAEERLRLMVHELNHRVKNSMAVVQAVAARTLRDSPTMESAGRSLTARLLALARAHDLLTAESWAGADLADVAARTLGAVAVDMARVRIAGCRVRLRPPAAVTFALVFHELATNALKYGALSTEGGRIDLEWTVDAEARRLSLTWRETGGPRVSPPERRGFGSQLIERGLSAEAGGKVQVEYRPEGLVCTIDGQMDRLTPQG